MSPGDQESALSAEEIRDMHDPNVGAGTPETAPLEDVSVGVLRRYPVLVLALVLFLPTVGAAVNAWAQGQTVTAIVTTAVSALIAALTPLVHRAVTPVADPKLEEGTPLVVR